MQPQYAVWARLMSSKLIEGLEVLTELLDVKPDARSLQDR